MTDFGISIFFNEAQSQKARFPIEITEDGILTFFNDEHPLNESYPISKTDESNSTSVILTNIIKFFFPHEKKLLSSC